MPTVFFAVIVVGLIVALTVWLHRRGYVVIGDAAQMILDFLRGLFGG